MKEKLTYLQDNLKENKLIRWPDVMIDIYCIAPFFWKERKKSKGIGASRECKAEPPRRQYGLRKYLLSV